MALVGTLTWLGLMLLGVPLALPLSLLVMLLVFVRRLYFEDVLGDEPEARESRKG